METSIKIKESTKKKLNMLKYKLGYKSIDETISAILKIITKFKIANEMEGGKEDGVMERLWFNGAGDHIFELQIPEKLPKELKERLVSFKDFVLDLRMKNATKEDKDKVVQEAKDLIREIDSFYGIETEKGEWE